MRVCSVHDGKWGPGLMFGRLLVCVVMVNAGAGDDPTASVPGRTPDRTAYEAARKAAGQDAAAQVRLALWCEQHGMTAERMKHLAMAVLHDPSNGLARGLMGLVAHDGKWESPDEVSRRTKADAVMSTRLAEYNGRRDRLAPTAEAHWKLALWCEQAGLKAEAKAHLATVTQLDPRREAAWKHLGFKKVGSRWVTEAQLTAERIEAKAQNQANAHWKPLLIRWRGWLLGKDRHKKQDAEGALAGVTEPRAVHAVWSVLATGDSALQEKAVQVLGQIEAPGSTRALAMLSLLGRSLEVRRAAVTILRRRDPRDFLGVLIGMVRDPLKYEIRPGAQRNSPGQLFVEGRRYNVNRQYFIDQRTYDLLNAPLPRLFDSSVPFDPFGPQNVRLAIQGMAMTTPGVSFQTVGPATALPRNAQASPAAKAAGVAVNPGSQQALANNEVIYMEAMAAQRDLLIAQRMVAAEQVVEISRQQLRDDIQAVEAYNTEVLNVNDLAVPILTYLTGQDLGPSHEAWDAWWTDQRGYAYTTPDPDTKPTYTEFVENPVVAVFPPHNACFGAGTLVHTLDGPRAIESIRIGDQVLSQDARSGKLSFTPVVAVFHNKPAATLRIKLGDQAIVATTIHRFWKAGKGWVMARELKPGDILRVLGGTARVVAVDPDRVQPVFNLEVADGQSFFVGQPGALVHDNSLVQTVPEPFDAVAPSAEKTAGKPNRSMLGR